MPLPRGRSILARLRDLELLRGNAFKGIDFTGSPLNKNPEIQESWRFNETGRIHTYRKRMKVTNLRFGCTIIAKCRYRHFTLV
jgi:hypothetical protein